MPGTIKLTTLNGTEVERAIDDIRRKPTPFDRTLAEEVVFHVDCPDININYMNFRSQPGAVENAAHNALVQTIHELKRDNTFKDRLISAYREAFMDEFSPELRDVLTERDKHATNPPLTTEETNG